LEKDSFPFSASSAVKKTVMKTDFPRGKKEFAELSAMLADVFIPSHACLREVFLRDFTLDPAFRPEFSRVIHRKGRIVANVSILEKTVRIGRARFRMGGIGAVTCAKEYRGQNLPSICMEDALATMRRAGMSLSFLLCGQALSGYYPRFGYTETWPEQALKLETRHLKDLQSTLRVRSYKAADAAALADLYNAAAAATSGSVIRDARRFHFGVLREDLLATSKADPQGCVHVFERSTGVPPVRRGRSSNQHNPRAYVVCRAGEFWEAGFQPGDDEAASGVLAWLRERCGKDLTLNYLSAAHPLWKFARRFPHTLKGGMRWSHGGMGAILDVKTFLSALQPELEARINTEGIESEGHLHLVVAGQDHSLILGRAHHTSLMISTHRHILAARVECTPQALLQMALGTLSYEDIPGVKVSGDKALLKAVFPQAAPNLYRLDYF